MSGLDVVAFIDELALLAVLALGGASVGVADSLRVLLAVALPVAGASIWAVLLAPRASRRLTGRAGIAVKIMLFWVASVLVAETGSILWAVVFGAVSTVLWLIIDLRARHDESIPSNTQAR